MLGTGEPRLQPLAPELRAWTDALTRGVDPLRLRAEVERLPGPRNRLDAPEAMARADDLILQGFRAAGWPAERQPFTLSNILGYLAYGACGPTVYPRIEGANIVARKEGQESSDAVVVLGHHDTVRGSPGADDNTAAVAALLELARLLAPHRFRRTVILAATDMEEWGFFGARALIKTLGQGRRILGAINFETMAYTASAPNSQVVPPGMGLLYRRQVGRVVRRGAAGDFTLVIYNGPAKVLATSFAAALSHIAGPHVPILLRDPNDLPVVGRVLPRVVPVVRNFARSDHVPFWEAGIPAVQITDTADFRNPHYHRPTDTPETLDYERLAAIVGAAAATLARCAGLAGGSPGTAMTNIPTRSPYGA